MTIVEIVSATPINRPLMSSALPEICEAIGAEQGFAASVAPAMVSSRVKVGAVDAYGIPIPVGPSLESYLSRAPQNFTNFDPLRPQRSERNRIFHFNSLSKKRRDALRTHAAVHLLPQLGLDDQRMDMFRVLVCDGATLLRFILCWREGTFAESARRDLAHATPLVRDRLRLEEVFYPFWLAGLEVAMDAIAGIALLVSDNGTIIHANRAGRERSGNRTLQEDVRAALRGDRTIYEVTPLNERGWPIYHLLVKRSTHDARSLASRACTMWELTVRQMEVLALVLRGDSNKAIASSLNLVPGTVELHVSAILKRAGVVSRAALFHALLGSRGESWT